MDANQPAGYNCQNVDQSAYGAGNYGTCSSEATQANTTQPTAPDTGSFMGFVTSGSFSILLPLLVAIVLVLGAVVAVAHKKRTGSK